jgi:hypothetical protein
MGNSFAQELHKVNRHFSLFNRFFITGLGVVYKAFGMLELGCQLLKEGSGERLNFAKIDKKSFQFMTVVQPFFFLSFGIVAIG